MIKIGNIELHVGLVDGKRIFAAFEHAASELDLVQTTEDFKALLEPAARAAIAAVAEDRDVLAAILEGLEPAKAKLFSLACDAIVSRHGQEYLDDLMLRFGQSKFT